MKIFLLAILTLILLMLFISYVLFYIGCVRFKTTKYSHEKKFGKHAKTIENGVNWFVSQKKEDITIAARDGTRLTAQFLPARQSKGTIILFHGYRAQSFIDFSCAYKMYHDLGYSILNVTQRSHGMSGGTYITFGVKERFDCLDWALYVLDRFGPASDIFLGGMSMGASTVLMAAGTKLPSNVRGIIADSGFSSPYDEFSHVLKRIHFPIHPFADIANVYAKVLAGFEFKEYSTIEAMKKNKIPVLFIHGEADNFVPMKFSLESYDACISDKTLVTVADAGHGMAYLFDTPRCRRELFSFLSKNSTADFEAFTTIDESDFFEETDPGEAPNLTAAAVKISQAESASESPATSNPPEQLPPEETVDFSDLDSLLDEIRRSDNLTDEDMKLWEGWNPLQLDEDDTF